MTRTLRNYEYVHGETHVERVMIRTTDDAMYPSGWKYALHYGEVGGRTLLRYDNSHEQTRGHDRHTPSGVEQIDFPGMATLYHRFLSEIGGLPP